MRLEAIGKAFLYRWPGGEVRLEPGKPIELPPDRAAKLMARASGRIRQVELEKSVLIEPAAPNARPVWWEDANGLLCGPAIPEYLAKTGGSLSEHFWVVVTHEHIIRWIRSDRLRSKPSGKKSGEMGLKQGQLASH